MVLRFTKKLPDKLKIASLQDCEYESGMFEEWYGHLFTAGRIQYIIFTNAFSLYSGIIPAKGILTIRNFMDLSFSCLDEVMRNDALGILMETYITPKTDIIDVCKTNNRGILGSMNDMIYQSKYFLTVYNLSPSETSNRLNTAPFSYIKFETPLSILKELVVK